jgi:hypothetical protein
MCDALGCVIVSQVCCWPLALNRARTEARALRRAAARGARPTRVFSTREPAAHPAAALASQDEVKVVEQLGKFFMVARPGYNCLLPCLCQFVKGTLSMRLMQLDITCETKTNDNVFVVLKVGSAPAAAEPYPSLNLLDQPTPYLWCSRLLRARGRGGSGSVLCVQRPVAACTH